MPTDEVLTRIFDKIENLGKEMKSGLDSLKDDMNEKITEIKVKIGQQDVFRRPAPECTVFVNDALEKEMKEKCENLEKRKMNKPSWLSIGVIISVVSIVGTFAGLWIDERFDNVKNQIENHTETINDN